MLKKEIYLVEENEDPIATFELQTTKPYWYNTNWFTVPDGPSLYLFHMAVLPAHQKRAVGRGVMEKIESIARERGFRAVRLDAYAAAAGAGAFYSKCGYKLVFTGSFNGVSLAYYEKHVSD
ncbi:MAG: GNAT family N-acetyltransferase [Pseudomonadota bacterium]